MPPVTESQSLKDMVVFWRGHLRKFRHNCGGPRRNWRRDGVLYYGSMLPLADDMRSATYQLLA